MAYLSDIDAGGDTTFPLLGIKAIAKKGSAIFWVNMRTDCRGNMLTYHGGCPVLVGSKWITNKWIYSHDQAFRFPCKIDPIQKLPNLKHDLYHRYRNWNTNLNQ